VVENVLIQAKTFHLPGKKALLSKENAGRKIAVDVTESPIERPKKTKKLVFRQEKEAHDKDANLYRCGNAGDSLYGTGKGHGSRFFVVQDDDPRDYFWDSVIGGQRLSGITVVTRKQSDSAKEEQKSSVDGGTEGI
jgi:hypothetical protein